MISPTLLEQFRQLLCQLQDEIRDRLIAARSTAAAANFADIAEVTAADTIYAIDKISEDAILEWFAAHWPQDQPVELVAEGMEDREVTFPVGTPAAQTKWKCILDPIDGTRNIMYDKRSAWSLAGLAPQRGEANRLSDIVVAAMTELPTSKQWRSDQISGIKGTGAITAEAVNILDGSRESLSLRPSGASNFKHGFASIARFFPEGKSLMAKLEEDLWDQLYGLGSTSSPLVFDDQYITSGGQIYELLVGHDRMLGDLRPFALKKLGFESSLVCHPYDVCTAFLLEEAGGILESPGGTPLDGPLDTVSAISWMGYANEKLASTVRPLLVPLMEKHFGC